MITLTDAAADKLKTLITGSKQLRVLIKGTGCSGMAYHLEYNIMQTDMDDLFIVKDIPIVIDRKSQVYVVNSENPVAFTDNCKDGQEMDNWFKEIFNSI